MQSATLKTFTLCTLLLAITLLAGCAQQPIVGGDVDAHGCIGSAGYTWCELKARCVRPWEEPCTSVNVTPFCLDESIARVEQCGAYTKVTSSLPGAGSTLYDSHGGVIRCPVVAPSAMSTACRNLLFDEDDSCTLICTQG